MSRRTHGTCRRAPGRGCSVTTCAPEADYAQSLPQVQADERMLVPDVEQSAGDRRVGPPDARKDLRAGDRRETLGRRGREHQLAVLAHDQQASAGERDAAGAESILAPADLAGLEFHRAEALAELLPSVKTVKISARIHAGRVVIREHVVR